MSRASAIAWPRWYDSNSPAEARVCRPSSAEQADAEQEHRDHHLDQGEAPLAATEARHGHGPFVVAARPVVETTTQR